MSMYDMSVEQAKEAYPINTRVKYYPIWQFYESAVVISEPRTQPKDGVHKNQIVVIDIRTNSGDHTVDIDTIELDKTL